MVSILKRVFDEPKFITPTWRTGGTKENYKDVEDEIMIKRILEEKLGEITHKEFINIMDKFYEVNGYYLGRNASNFDMNLLSTYLDEIRRMKNNG